jgi:hypothetical protein
MSLGEHGYRTSSTRVGIAMSPDGRLVAVGYPGGGRSWIVIEVDSDRFLQRSTMRMDAARIGGKKNAPQLFAFDYAGTRLATRQWPPIITPEKPKEREAWYYLLSPGELKCTASIKTAGIKIDQP